MKSFLPDFHVEKLLPDSAHDAMPYYLYRKQKQAFIDLNEKHGIWENYKYDFTIGKNGIPVCKAGRKTNHAGTSLKRSNRFFILWRDHSSFQEII